MKLNTKRIIFILIASIGFLILIVGVFQSNIQLKTILISFGSSLIGASLSNFFSLIGLNIFEVLANSGKLPNIEKGIAIEPYRKKYFCYYITKDKSESHWRMYTLDYSKFAANNYLFGDLKMKSDNGVTFEYNDMAFLSEKRLVSIAKPKTGNESPVIYFFPNFGKEYSERSVGLGVFENWNKTDMIAPMIISKNPINGYKKIGRIEDSEIEIELQKIVKNELPEIILSK